MIKNGLHMVEHSSPRSGGSPVEGRAQYVGHLMPAVSVIILNWRDEAATVRCVRSVFASNHAGPIEVIVVDNESTPHSRSVLGECAGIKVVTSSLNLGFAGGMNLGVAHASHAFVALLNNDLVIADDWVAQGVSVLDKRWSVAVVGGVSYHLSAAHPAFDRTNPCDSVTIIDPRFGTARLANGRSESRVVASLDGGALLLRAEVWRQVGGFDPDYFAYGEDVDFAARVMALQYILYFESDMATWHARNSSSDRVPRRRAFWAKRNQLFNIAKHYPETRWRGVVFRVVGDHAWRAVSGRTEGLRSVGPSPRLSTTERLASLTTCIWFVFNYRLLHRKRCNLQFRGLHDEQWIDKVALLSGSELIEVLHSGP